MDVYLHTERKRKRRARVKKWGTQHKEKRKGHSKGHRNVRKSSAL